jgi:hypothetical protein
VSRRVGRANLQDDFPNSRQLRSCNVTPKFFAAPSIDLGERV